MEKPKRGSSVRRKPPFRRGVAQQEKLREDARNVRRRDEAEEDLARDAYQEDVVVEAPVEVARPVKTKGPEAPQVRGARGARDSHPDDRDLNDDPHDRDDHDDHDERDNGHGHHNEQGGHDDHDDVRERNAAPRRPVAARVEPYGPVSEYTLFSYYDKGLGQYVVTVAEYPELKLQGANRNALLEELEQKLEDQFEIMRRRGEATPESISSRQYPERLEVPISSGLYRRLDWLSRLQRVSLEKLVTEILAAGIERRLTEGQRNGAGGADRRPQQHSQRHQGGNHQGGGGHQRDRHQGGGRQGGGGGHRHGGGGGQPRGRAYHDTMDNRENFLEYVRNLEKNKFRK